LTQVKILKKGNIIR